MTLEAAGVIGTLVGLVVGGACGLYEHFGKRRAEKELALMRRRGEAPYFAPSDFRFDQFYYIHPTVRSLVAR